MRACREWLELVGERLRVVLVNFDRAARRRRHELARAGAAAMAIASLAGCAAGPDYVRPADVVPAKFKEGGDVAKANAETKKGGR